MRWARGFFRLWLVGSALALVASAFVGLDNHASAYDAWERYTTLPAPCAAMRGALGIDYGYQEIGPGPWDQYDKPPEPPVGAQRICWQPITTFERLNPDAIRGQDRIAYVQAALNRYSPGQIALPQPSAILDVGFSVLAAALGASLALGVGLVFRWILLGFARS